mgnify:CR=1 FL=1
MNNTYAELYKKYADEFEAKNIANTHFPTFWDSQLKQYGNYEEDLATVKRERKEYWVVQKVANYLIKEKKKN